MKSGLKITVNIFLFSALALGFWSFQIHSVSAQTPTPSSVDFEIENPIESESLMELIDAIAGWILAISIPISVIAIIYAGILFLTSQGVPAKVSKAKDILKYAIIGLAIIMIGRGFVTLIQSILDLGATP